MCAKLVLLIFCLPLVLSYWTMPNNGNNNMPMNGNMGGGNMPMNSNMGGGNMPMNGNMGGGNRPMNGNMGGGNMPMNGNMGGGYNNGYNMNNNNNFQISDYISTRTEQTFESAPFFSMLTPQEQQQLVSMLQDGSITKQQRASRLMQWSSTLPSNAQQSFNNFMQQIMQVLQQLGQRAQNMQCSSQAQSYCQQMTQDILDQTISLPTEEQEITNLMNQAPYNVRMELQQQFKNLDSWYVQQLQQQGLISGGPLAMMMNSSGGMGWNSQNSGMGWNSQNSDMGWNNNNQNYGK